VNGWAVRDVREDGPVLSGTASIDPADPVFAGHYPGFPILPGLYLVEYVHSLVRATRGVRRPAAVERVRFASPVYGGDVVRFEAHLSEVEGGLRCNATASVGEQAVAQIRLRYAMGGSR
jgi:3-hydroxyacyl-[acyl-carrier-protein] dehydratase